MQKLLYTQKDIYWLPKVLEPEIETYLSDELPPLELCASVQAFVFKDGAFLQTDLREGERDIRRLDIPGGHMDPGETPEEAVVRETFEETGVHVDNPRLVAYKKIVANGPKPEEYKYLYPISHMLFYVCDFVEETDFDGNDDTHGRVWLQAGEYEKSEWGLNEKALINEVLKHL